MNRTDLSTHEYGRLIEAITPVITRKGLKATTMDHVAATLGISKRTLYEIFESKAQMIKEVLDHVHELQMDILRDIFGKSETVMEAMIGVFHTNRDIMRLISVEFLRDMDGYFKEMRSIYEKCEEDRHREMLRMFNLGVSQGVFRADVNYDIQSRIMKIQMESLKRMEELFPPDITLQEVYDAITVSFLRGIATPKGMEILEHCLAGGGTPTRPFFRFSGRDSSDN